MSKLQLQPRSQHLIYFWCRDVVRAVKFKPFFGTSILEGKSVLYSFSKLRYTFAIYCYPPVSVSQMRF